MKNSRAAGIGQLMLAILMIADLSSSAIIDENAERLWAAIKNARGLLESTPSPGNVLFTMSGESGGKLRGVELLDRAGRHWRWLAGIVRGVPSSIRALRPECNCVCEVTTELLRLGHRVST